MLILTNKKVRGSHLGGYFPDILYLEVYILRKFSLPVNALENLESFLSCRRMNEAKNSFVIVTMNVVDECGG